jgi:hypothetical protein
VTLRKRLHRDPTLGEFRAACEDEDNKYQDITPEDIRMAYDRGEEVSIFPNYSESFINLTLDLRCLEFTF